MRDVILLMIVAQAGTDVPIPGLLGWLIQGGSFAVLCFVLWWLLTKYLPQQTKTFAETLAKITEDSAAQRTTFQEESQRNRELFASQIQRANDQLIDALSSKDEQ